MWAGFIGRISRRGEEERGGTHEMGGPSGVSRKRIATFVVNSFSSISLPYPPLTCEQGGDGPLHPRHIHAQDDEMPIEEVHPPHVR